MSSTWIALAVAFVSSLVLTGPIRLLALHIGLVDLPGPRKLHLKPTPLLGGLAIYAGFSLAVVVSVRSSARAEILAIFAGATLLAIIGILDDSGRLHHQIKLFVGMPMAACILVASGIRAQVFSTLIAGKSGLVLDVALTIFWVVGITAAFSILDHMDGLCAGVAAVAAAFFIMAASLNGQLLVRNLAAASLGAAFGFLCWNFAPAKIFMGDGGAMLLGFLMATIGLKLRPISPHIPADWFLPVLILGFPIFDTMLIIVSRSRRGLLPFASPGKDHTAHRLANLGLGYKRAVLSIYALGCVFGGLALLLAAVPPAEAGAICVAVLFVSALAVLALEKFPFEHQQKPNGSPSLP
ncbi:MAG TPA: MraY family glycosyltransferase [Candidatus Methylomirabilis sp.]|nr:MraY family glycosyltransferase [Candidatus Methylomirabilis sp.]